MSILQQIAQTKLVEIAGLKKETGLEALREAAQAQPPPRDFLKAIHCPGKLSLIAELKKASPSKGLLRQDFQVDTIAKTYAKAGAQALSVLTDVQYFQGSMENLKIAKASCDLPVLRKDFILDEIQIYQSRSAGADAILLIMAMMPPAKLKELLNVSTALKMASLVEVHDERELDFAIRSGAKIIGINNRNLNDFSVSLQTTLALIEKCPKGIPIVSESGIYQREDAIRLHKAGASAILVGEAFMTAKDLEAAVRTLMPEI